jgi:prephenate dehydratase
MKKVAIRGIEGSFHDQVASSAFGSDYQAAFCSDFSEIARKVETEECDFGVMAIENSLAGTILENYNILRDNYIEIIGEKYLQIDHNLLALPGQRIQNIETVISHEMALKQCRKFLDTKEIVTRQSFADTASASQHIVHNQIKGTAAIGSLAAAKNYGLEILSTNIQDNPKNYTRFLIVQKPKTTGLSVKENKATIIFSVVNEAGKLALLLNFLHAKGINLTKIESVPQVNNPGKFDMITDLELSEKTNFKDILPELYQVVDEIKVLGIYTKASEPWI